MKKLLSVFALFAMLLTLVACTGAVSPPSTTAPTTTPPLTPPPTTSAPIPDPPPDPLTDEQKIELLSATLEAMTSQGSFAAEGAAQLRYADGSETELALTGCVHNDERYEVSFSLRSSSALCFELYLKDRVLYILREQAAGTATLDRFDELSLYEVIRERSQEAVTELSRLRELLSEYASELDAILGLSGEKLTSAEILALVSFLGDFYTEALNSLGVSLAPSFSESFSVRDAAKALYYLCGASSEDFETVLTLTPTRILSLLSSLFDELDARLDVTVSAILDEFLGQGQTSELYRRLAAFTGESTLSAWRAEVESILISEGISPSLFYELLASVLNRMMTAEMTLDRLMKLFDENAEKSLDRVIGLFLEDKTYAGFLRDLHSILSMPPTSIYVAFGGIGDLRERILAEKEKFSPYVDSTELCLAFSFNESSLTSASLSVSFDLPSEHSRGNEHRLVGASLSLVMFETDLRPTPSEQLKNHPDFEGH